MMGEQLLRVRALNILSKNVVLALIG
jgi:hypothetical protein